MTDVRRETAEFALQTRVLSEGRGSAALRVAAGDADLDLLVEACTGAHAERAGWQTDRGLWLAELARSAGVAERVVAVLRDRGARTAEGEALCVAVACRLAERDVPGALDLAYALARYEVNSGSVVGEEYLVERMGANGLLHVARERGRVLTHDALLAPEPLDLLDRRDPFGGELARFEEHAAADPDAARWLAAVEERMERSARLSKATFESPSAAEIAERVRTSPDRAGRFERWARRVDDAECEELLGLAFTEPDPEVAVALLQPLTRWSRARHAFEPRILGLARLERASSSRRPSVDPRRNWYGAVTIAAGMRGDAVRDLALEWLSAGDLRGGLWLLEANAVDADAERLSALELPTAGRDWHAVFQCLADLDGHEAPVAARTAYGRVWAECPCALCRGVALERWIELGDVPRDVLDEARFDVEPDTRALARAALDAGAPPVTPARA